MMSTKHIYSLTPSPLTHSSMVADHQDQLDQVATSYKYQTTRHNKSVFEHLQTELSKNQTNNCFMLNSKIKRRISTAGTSKRFPKDFFKNFQKQNINKAKKQSVLIIKQRKSLPHSVKNKQQQPCKKSYRLNIEIRASQNNNINTPKFNEPQPKSELHQNQFIQIKPIEKIRPFPLLQQLNIESIEQIHKSTRPNFVKKIKKGEYLKYKKQLSRSISQNNQITGGSIDDDR